MSNQIKLRDYQQDIVIQTINSNNHTLIQVPTGGGKTVISRFIAFDLAHKQGKQVLFVAPKLVLMEQTLQAFKDINPQKVHGSEYYNPKHKILVSTLQTASRREELQPDVIIIDEIHHGYDGSMIEKLIKDKPHTRVIGLSATPYDRKGKLLKGFKVILDKYDMNYMIEHNFLVGLKPYVLVRQDLSEVKITAGDYNLGELSQVVCNKNTILEIIETTQKFILKSKKTIVFAVDITHAELLTKAYIEKGFNAKALHSKIKKDEVKKEIELFRDDKTQVLVSVLMLTTGFDVPDTDCAVIARPTKSQNLYKQMVGRVLRIAPDKTSAILLDCGNVIDNLGMPLEPIREISRADTKSSNKQKCSSCGTDDIKLIKKDNKLYWECQNKKCLFLKEVKQGAYECENCHLIHSHTSNYIFENDKIILNCECGSKTVVSEYKKQEVFFEVDKVLKENPWIKNIMEWSENKGVSNKLLTSKKILNLRELFLNYSNLEEIPVEIGKLTKLRTLSLKGNHLIKLPDEITNLKNLKELWLHENKELVLSENQKKWLKELKKNKCDISLDENIDTRIKDEMWITELEKWAKIYNIDFFIPINKSMIDLKKIYGANKKLNEIPKEIGHLKNLKQLYLYNNNLKELPKEIVNLKNLKELWLHENKELVLSENQKEWLKELKNNKCKVSLDNNIDIRTKDEEWITELEKWGENFGIHFFIAQKKTMADLKELHILDRNVDYIPSEIGNLINLKKFYASNNNLKELPKEIVNLKNLKELWLHKNPNLILTEEQKEWLGELKNNRCKIYIDIKIDYSIYKKVKLIEIPKQKELFFEKVKKWNTKNSNIFLNKKIIILNERLEFIPKEIEQFIKLEELDLSGNNIKVLPNEIINLTGLKRLSLNRNKLTEVPTIISQLINLEELDLSNNKLKKLPEQIIKLKKLKKFYILHNSKDFTFTEEQKEWLIELMNNDCNIHIQSKIYREILKRNDLKKNKCKISLDNNIDIQTKDEEWITELEKWSKNHKIDFNLKTNKSILDLRYLFGDNKKLNKLPKELGKLKYLEELYLYANNLKALPSEIINLKNLKKITLSDNQDLVLTKEQKEWLRELENNQCKIYIDIDYSEEKEIEIVEVDKEENLTFDKKEEPLLNRFLKWFR